MSASHPLTRSSVVLGHQLGGNLLGWMVGPPCGFCGWVFQSSGKERNVPIQSLGGCPGRLGAVGKSSNVRNSALQVVTSLSVQSEPEVGWGSWEDEGGGFTTCLWLGSETVEGWPRNPATAFKEGLVELAWQQLCCIVSLTFPSLTTLLKGLENWNYAVEKGEGKSVAHEWVSEWVCVCVCVYVGGPEG